MSAAVERYDVAVIGGGPGGYVAALRAAEHGLRAALIERDRLGGVCANQGCIPTKALLRSAEVFALARDAESFGLHAGEVTFDLAAIVERARQTAARMEKTVEVLLRQAKVDVLRGTASLAGSGRVEIVAGDGSARTIEAAHVVLATGARPRVPDALRAAGPRLWTYREALAPPALPASILIAGAGAIGVEFASFFRAFGCEVTLVEMLDRILPAEDEEVSEAMRRALAKRGIRVVTGAKVVAVEEAKDGVSATVESARGVERIACERLLAATGIEANVESLGLEGTRVVVERGRIVVDPFLATAEPGVYAIGDITGPPWLAHKASREATVCIDRIAGVAGVRPLDPTLVPACTYSSPQVASVGLGESAAKQAGRRVRVGKTSLVGNGKARAIGDTEGFVKTIFDAETGELLGAHMVGPEVTELISTFALARTLEATEAEILATVFPHPTLAEALHESVAAAFRD